MIQIFILGSSSVYGVGGVRGGWADLVKQAVHEKMFGKDGVGEKYEVYNFGKSGATIEFVMKTFPKQLEDYGRGGKTIAIVSVGGNNAKAENEPDNFVSTIEEYADKMGKLLDMLKQECTHVMAVGSGYYDKSKVNPKPNPLTGGKSYFSNKRQKRFQEEFMRLCNEREISFVEIEVSEKEWLSKYIAEDGLHPNSKGHLLISKLVMKKLEKVL